MIKKNVHFVASNSDEANHALDKLLSKYHQSSPEDAEIIVALGGDGFMLETLHNYLPTLKPVFGIHRGSVGFLMNEYREENLLERVFNSEKVILHPLKMKTISSDGDNKIAHAINEVSLLRETRQAAKVRIYVNGQCRLKELICDGILICTPAGSTAYNLSVEGPVLPLGANLLAITSISAFRPRRWRGAIVPNNSQIKLEILESEKRPVSAVADRTEFRNITEVTIEEDLTKSITLLFDPEHNLEERILSEQFLP